MKKLLILLFSLISISFITLQDDELYQNYLAAARNDSTFPFNLVITAKNMNTGETREICTDGNQFRGALYEESNLDYSNESYDIIDNIIAKNKQRYFEFKNQNAYEHLIYATYSIKELKKLEKKIDFDKLSEKIKKDKKFTIYADDKKLIMYAHALFNRGVLTGQSNCMGGGTLTYIDRDNPF